MLFVFCCFTQVLSAQNSEIYIEGPQEVCGGCYNYNVVVSGIGQPPPVVDSVFWVMPDGSTLITLGDSTHTVCWELFGPGTYTVPVIVRFTNGEITETQFILSVYGEASPPIYSTAGEVCPAANDDIPDGGGCEKLCPNSTVTYTVSTQGTIQDLNWEVVGAESWEHTGFNSITVQWGGPGTGSVSVYTFDFCEGYSTICVEILEEPVANFNTNPAAQGDLLSICEGQTVYFENTSQGAASYHWTFGILGTSDEVNPAQVFNAPGTYEVTLIAYNECLCADTTSLSIEVIDAESPFVDCVGTVCEGETVTYTSDATCGIFNWAVSPNGTITEGGGTGDDFVTVSWDNGPEGTIELIVDDCSNTNVCLEPNLVQIPILSDGATIDGPAIVCKGQITNYSVVPYEGTDFIWTVSSFGTILEGQGTNEITVEWFGGFIVTQPQTVSVTYDNCYLDCGGASSLEVNMKPEIFIDGPIEVCENASVTFEAINTQNNMPSPANWTLAAADGSTVWTSTGATGSPMIDFTYAPGTYTLSLVPANPLDFCVGGFETNVRIVTAPPAVDNIEGEDDICPGQAYTYEAISGQPNNIFRWSINDGGTISERTGNPINVTWGATAPYEISVIQVSTSGIPCESDAVVLPIQAITGFVITGDDEVCQDQISLYSTTGYAEVDYVWSIIPNGVGTITGDPNASNIEILWHTGGPATVSLDLCGQNTTFAVNVRPTPQPVAVYPAELCATETAQLMTTIAYDSYLWKDENGSTVSTLATPDLGPGYYQVEVTDVYGCVGDTTFFIDGYPESEINISTPDFTRFCNVPISTTMYGLNSSAGYTYQWYQNGSPIAGETGPIYTTTTDGAFQLQITDANNCEYFSNTIAVSNDCSGGGGPSGGVSCGGTSDLAFDVATTTECNVLNFQNLSVDVVPGTIRWIFSDPASGSNTATGPVVSHTFSAPGFYKVFQLGDFDDGMGGVVTCFVYQVVEIPLSASFEYDNACPSEVVAFADLSTFLPGNSITSWSWDFGDPGSGVNNTSIDQNPTHIFDNPGDYDVSLTITAGSGCTSTIVKTLTVYPPPPVSFEEPVVNCERTASNFVADVSSTVTYVHWDFGDPGSGDANTSNLFDTYHVFANPGTYTVTLFAQSIYGCSNSFTRTITIEPNSLAGDISLSIPSPLCEGDSTVLTPPAGGTIWAWSTGDTTETITVGEAGIYNVTITDVDGCSYEPLAVTIDVLPAPEAPIRVVTFNEYQQPTAYFYLSYEACQGEDIFLEAIETTGYTYQWSNGDIGPGTEYSDDRGNQLLAGDYEISLTVTDQNSCSNVMTFSITVHPLPANIQIVASVAGLICESTETTFSVVSPDPALDYIWNTGEVGTNMTTAAAGDYYVRAINEFGCETESNTLSITAGPDISKVPSGCHTRCRPDTLCMPLIPGVVSYQWYFNGAPIPGPNGTQTDLIADEDGDYYLEMVSTQGCVLNSGVLSLEFYDGFGTFEGNVYFDVNENGIIDGPDTLVSGIDINLLVANTVTNTVTSDGSGFYQFANVLATNYTLELDSLTFPEDVSAYEIRIDTALVGCDDEVEINWLLFLDCPDDMVHSVAFSGCEGDVVSYNGMNFTSDTTFTVTYTSITGCDSTEMVTIDLIEVDDSLLELGACPGETVFYDGVELSIGDQQDFVLVNAAGCDSTVSVSVLALPSSVEQLQLDVCAGETIQYNGMELSAGDLEEITLTNAAGCDSIINVMVMAYATPSVTVSTEESCPNENSGRMEADVQGGNGPFTYSIDGQNFQNDNLFEDLPSGDYTLYSLDANGCTQEMPFQIEALPELQVSAKEFFLPCDLLETTLEVDVLSGGGSDLTYLWDDGSILEDRLVAEPGTYTLMVSNTCETVEQSFTVDYEEHSVLQAMYIPNAFSPNEDGVNDRFLPIASLDIAVDKFEMNIFDRWGNQLYRSENPTEGWDGAKNGKQVKSGVYVWRLKATVNACGQLMEVVKEGDVTLLR
ncbi:MAG: hypothetical protein DHS20C18_20830 [Saprospiraceae bacterium]|nr:MAG: hypothetical protein DHS20C18_20830 [Saprospiraceae bacterium]